MTTKDPAPDDQRGHPATAPGGYEWTCPYCGTSRLNSSAGESAEQNAIAALQAHIVATDGAEHGPRNEYPTDESLALSDYVREVEAHR